MYIPVLAMLYLLFDIWYWYLPCYAYYLISDTGTCHTIFDPWYLTTVLAMLYLIYDLWHRHTVFIPTLDMLYLILDPRYLISDTGTCHASLDTWHTATWYQYTWPDIVTWLDTITADTVLLCILMIITFTGTSLLYCYQTFGTPELRTSKLLNP